ncbi:hypothetical protein BU25DRAFT_443245 [Macroventuria anomochaeta]|uniref:Uncharacterized protein n=1 Tax=Macroventuria anomochaeta TaxID=301207 RepID=A0ACB6RNB6_9PLEO|nr:uncharacterized protein BU25DRAFT_443245 [Macroventuria anomochaeta]KAF2622404.1 hypothetical protein BU25DRAFT_443245 [Macroventuria anomochaeta]
MGKTHVDSPCGLGLEPRSSSSDFTSLNWCQGLLLGPSITRIQKRQVPDQHDDVSNTLFTKMLFTDEALRAFLSMAVFTENTSSINEGAKQGQPAVLGSSILSKEEQRATLLDQVMCTLISYVYDNTCATADLNVKHKAAVTTPCVLLCRAKVVKKKGQWIESVGWVEDGQGKVFAESKGAFVI